MNRSFTGLAHLVSDKHPNFACFLSESKKRKSYYRGPLGACLTQTCVRQSDLGATKHTPMVRHPLALLNPTIYTKFSCGKCEKLRVVQQLVPGTKTSSFTLWVIVYQGYISRHVVADHWCTQTAWFCLEFHAKHSFSWCWVAVAIIDGPGTAPLGHFSAICTPVQWSWEGSTGVQVPSAEVQRCDSRLRAIGINMDNVFDELC